MQDKVPETWAEQQFQEAEAQAERREMAKVLGRAGGKKGGKVTASRRSAKKRVSLGTKAGLASWAARKADPGKYAAWRAACLAGIARRKALKVALLEAEEVANRATKETP